MKRFFIALFLTMFTVGMIPAAWAQNGQNQTEASGINWYTNFDQAAQNAQKTHLPLFLFFTGSDWCGWCKKMDQEIFSAPEFAQAVGNSFTFVYIDFPMNKKLPPEQVQQNTQLKQKYGVTGYPTVIILDYNQNFIAETGYRPGGAKAFSDYLRNLLS